MRDHLMASEWGVKAEYIGEGPEPKPSYRYDDSPRQAYLRALEENGGLHPPSEHTSSPEDQELQEAWRQLDAWKKGLQQRK